MAEAIASLLTDTESQLVQPCFVVIFAPNRGRKRFPEGCVQVHVDEIEARAAARPEQGYHAAVASGPARSSEGYRLYYLIRWLE